MVVWYVADGVGGRHSALFASEELLRRWIEEIRSIYIDDFDEYGNYLWEEDIVQEVVVTS